MDHMEEIGRPMVYIYRNCNYLWSELRGWKGFVTYGLGADISLPPCLETGIWTSLTKATHGPKSRGKSFGTTLWHRVQRYCCLGILLAHAQSYGTRISYHIRGKDRNLSYTYWDFRAKNQWNKFHPCAWLLASDWSDGFCHQWKISSDQSQATDGSLSLVMKIVELYQSSAF